MTLRYCKKHSHWFKTSLLYAGSEITNHVHVPVRHVIYLIIYFYLFCIIFVQSFYFIAFKMNLLVIAILLTGVSYSQG